MRWIRPICLALLAVALLIVASVVVLMNLDANRLKGNLERYVAAKTNRSFEITGSLDVDLGRHVRLTVNDVRLGNPQWAASKDMVQLDYLTIVVDLWSLIDSPLVIELFELSGAKVNLETQQNGENNWTFGREPQKDDKSSSKPIPLILQLARVDDFRLTYIDPDLQAPLQVHVASIEQRQIEMGLLEVSLKGDINARPVNISGQYGPFDSLLAGHGVEYQLSGEFDTLTITSAGHVDNLLNPVHPEFTLSIKGPDIDHVTEMLGLTDLGSGKLDVDASLRPQEDRLEAKVHGNLGEFFIDADAYATGLTDLRKAELQIKASGPNLGQAVNLFGYAGIPDDPFELHGNITRSGKLLTVERLQLNIGGSQFDVRGSMTQFPNLSGSTLDLNITGSDIARFRQLLGLPGAAAGSFNVDAELQISPAGTELLDVRIRTNLGNAKIRGTIGEPPEFIGTTLVIEVSGDNLQEFADAYRIPTMIAEPFELAGKIEIQKQKFVTLETIRVNVGGNSLEIDGTVGFDPLARDTDIRLNASGPDLSQIATMAGIDDGVPAETYGVRGRLQVLGNGYRIHDLNTTIGDAKIGLDGLLTRNADFAGSTVKFTASGPDLKDLLADTDRFDVPAGQFRASGTVTLGADELQVENLEIDAAGAELRAEANIVFPLGFSDFQSTSGQFEVSATGPDIGAVLPKSNLYQPDASSFAVHAFGNWDTDRWSFDKFNVELGAARLSLQGTLDQPPDWSATSLKLDAQIGSLAELGLINGRRLPEMLFELDTHFSGTPGTFEMDQLTARLGESDFSGQMALSLQQQIPDIDIRINSSLIDLDAFAEEDNQQAALAEEKSSEASADDRVIPDREIRLDILRKFNAHLALEAKQLLFKKKEYRDIALYADVMDGALNVHRAEAAGENGQLSATFAVLPENDAARVTGSLQGTDLFLGLARQTGDDVAIAPRIDMRIKLTGTGRTVRDVAATMTATARFITHGGRIPNTGFTSLFYGDFFTEVFASVNPFAKEDPYTNIVCFVVLLEASNGNLIVNPGIVMQTDKMNIVSTGVIDLVTEKVDLNFKTASRGRIGISAGQFINPYIKIAGTMANPKLTLDPEGTLVSGGAAVATLGLSILAKTAWDRVFRSKDPCGKAIAEADKR